MRHLFNEEGASRQRAGRVLLILHPLTGEIVVSPAFGCPDYFYLMSVDAVVEGCPSYTTISDGVTQLIAIARVNGGIC